MNKKITLTLCALAISSTTLSNVPVQADTINNNKNSTVDSHILKPVEYPSMLKINYTGNGKTTNSDYAKNKEVDKGKSVSDITDEAIGDSNTVITIEKEKTKELNKDQKTKKNEKVKDSKVVKKSINSKVDKEFIEDTVVPIYTKNTLNQDEYTSENAIINKEQMLLPLEFFRKVTPYTIKPNQYATRYNISLPNLRVAGDNIYEDSSKKQLIRLPLVTKNGKQYVDAKAMSAISGIYATIINEQDLNLAKPIFTPVRELKNGKHQISDSTTYQTDKVLSVETVKGAITKPTKVTVSGSLAWVFDPMVEDSEYDKLLVKKGTTVISPSWFKLTTSGLEVSSKMTYDYAHSYSSKNYRVWPLVTNQFDPNFTHGILADESIWDTYVQQLAMYALLYHFDGYNFDFENIDYHDKARLTKFVTYLTNNLHNYGIYTSIDVTGYSDSPNWSMVYDRYNLANNVDYMVLMAYDETWASSTKAGPVASYPWVKKNLDLLNKEVSASKIVLGVPFYMREWSEKTVNGRTTAKAKTLSIVESRIVKEKYKNIITWDDKLKLYYLNTKNENNFGQVNQEPVKVNDIKKNIVKDSELKNSEVKNSMEKTAETYSDYNEISTKNTDSSPNNKNTGSKISTNTAQAFTEVWFEDEKSMSYKIDLVKEYNLAGFAAWRKGFEDQEMLNSVEKEFEDKSVIKTNTNQKKNKNNKRDKKVFSN